MFMSIALRLGVTYLISMFEITSKVRYGTVKLTTR